MNVKTNDVKTCQIARCEKIICGSVVQYVLERCSDELYRICVSYHESEMFGDFNGDFFNIVELFKKVVDTETLPENIPDIAEDFKISYQM